jgi:hypothetical protein
VSATAHQTTDRLARGLDASASRPAAGVPRRLTLARRAEVVHRIVAAVDARARQRPCSGSPSTSHRASVSMASSSIRA